MGSALLSKIYVYALKRCSSRSQDEKNFVGLPNFYPCRVRSIDRCFRRNSNRIATLFINRRLQLIDLDLKRSTAAIAKQTAEIAAKQADLRESELRAAAALRASDTLLKRHEALRNDVCSLLTLLDLNRLSPGPIQGEVRKEILTKCNSISLFVSPRGKFDETLNVQLDHITAFLDEGEEYWRNRPGFLPLFG